MSILHMNSSPTPKTSSVSVVIKDSCSSDKSESFRFWYICQFCPRGFQNCDEFISHKEKYHLEDFIRNALEEKSAQRNEVNDDSEDDCDTDGDCSENEEQVQVDQPRTRPVSGKNPQRTSQQTFRPPLQPVAFKPLKLHEKKPTFQCRFCKKTMNSKAHQTDHEFAHLGHRPYKCKYCSKTFSWARSRASHEIICDFVKANAASKSSMKSIQKKAVVAQNRSSNSVFSNHRRQESSQNNFLRMKMSTSKSLKNETNEITNSRKNVNIRACTLIKLKQSEGDEEEVISFKRAKKTPNKLKRKSKLGQQHTKSNQSKSMKGKKNPVPKPTDASRFILKKVNAKNQITYVCKFCQQLCLNKQIAVKHYWAHIGYKHYRCSSCPKKFSTSVMLLDHESVHTGVKRHKCKYCHQLFRYMPAKSLHERKRACRVNS